MKTIFQTVLELSLFAAVLIPVLELFSRAFGKRYGVKWRYLLWMVLAVRLVLPVHAVLPDFLPRASAPAFTETAVQMTEQEEIPAPAVVPIQTADTVQVPKGEAVALPEALEEAEHTISPAEVFWEAAPVLWVLGMILFLSFQLLKYALFLKKLKRNRTACTDAEVLDVYYSLCREMGFKKRPQLFVCKDLPSPLCTGFLKQSIYIDFEEGAEAFSFILKHELVHCRRRDLWAKGLLLLAETVHFFNPLVHIMTRFAVRDMELSCDAAVMKDCGMEERKAYSLAIVSAVRRSLRKQTQLTTAFSGGKKDMKNRLDTIFDMTAKKRGLALFLAVLFVMVSGTAFLGCGNQQTATEEKKAEAVFHAPYTEEAVHALYEAKTEYIGKNTAVAKVLGALPLPDGIKSAGEGMELFTSEEPYGAKTFLEGSTDETGWAETHAMVFLSLVENAGFLSYDIRDDEGVTEFTFDRKDAQKYFGTKDLREFAETEESFAVFVGAMYRYFHEGMDAEALAALSPEEAQARMNGFLNGKRDFSAEWKQAEAAFEAIFDENFTTAEACTDGKAYRDFIALGDAARNYVMVEIATGLAGEEERTKTATLAAEELLGMSEPFGKDIAPWAWYERWVNTHSVIPETFGLDEKKYPVSMKEDYAVFAKDSKEQEEYFWNRTILTEDESIRAVYRVLEDSVTKEYQNEVSFFAPLVIQAEERENGKNGDTLTVYAVIFESTYAFLPFGEKEGAFVEGGGSVIPTRFDFKKEKGEWVLQNLTQTQDGSYYAPSIEEMCRDAENPKRVAKQMLLGNGDSVGNELLWQNILLYMKANGYDCPIYQLSYTPESQLNDIGRYAEVIPVL